MNSKDTTELKTKKMEKEIDIKGSDDKPKKFLIKIAEGQDVKISPEEKKAGKKEGITTIKAKYIDKSVDANKDKKMEDVDKEQEKNITVTYQKGTWWPYFEITEVDGNKVSNPEKTTLAVKGEKYWWPTLTLIIGGAVIGAALTGLLIWSLFKKDGDEE